MSKPEQAILELQDGRCFDGVLYGQPRAGEVVFTTAMTGYGEVLTDPSFAGQIVVMTFPMIGNYGLHLDHLEATGLRAAGLITRSLCLNPYHDQADGSLLSFIEQEGGFVLSEVDTRALTRHLRHEGTMLGHIIQGQSKPPLQPLNTAAAVASVSTPVVRQIGSGPRVTVVDYGLKEDITRQLVNAGLTVTILPFGATAEEIVQTNPDGVVFSPGPGDPSDLQTAARVVSQISERFPTFGICLGHPLLALAHGGRTYKLPFGHRGANHPVLDLVSGDVAITSQNHGYAVDGTSLGGTDLVVSHENLNDGTVEGLRHKTRPVFSLQYHPEAGPGPWDERTVFSRFVTLLAGGEVHA